MSLETLGTDINGRVDYSLPKPVRCRDELLGAAVAVTVTTPPNFNRAFFSYAVGTNVWVTLDGSTPVVPVGGSDTTQELNPGVRQISLAGGESIKAISDVASFLNIRYDLGA